MDFLCLFVKACVSVVGHSGSLVGSAGVWCCAARYHTCNWLIVLLMIMVLLIWLIIIVIGDNQNAGIAYCEEMQAQGKMLKGKWSGPTPQAALTSNTLLDGGVNRLVGLTECRKGLYLEMPEKPLFFFFVYSILLLVHIVQKTLVQVAWEEF